MTLLDKIKSRGNWEIQIRPATFIEDRVQNVLQLREIVRTKGVQLRGWDFPHYGREEPKIYQDFIAQEVDFLAHVESWRFYQSGLFAYFGGFRVDWIEQDAGLQRSYPHIEPGTRFSIGDTVCVLAETFEFAANLALSDAGDDRMHITATAHGLRGRRLWMDLPSRSSVERDPVDALESFPQSQEYSKEELVSESRMLGLKMAQEVFRRFGWDAPMQILEEIRSEFR